MAYVQWNWRHTFNLLCQQHQILSCAPCQLWKMRSYSGSNVYEKQSWSTKAIAVREAILHSIKEQQSSIWISHWTVWHILNKEWLHHLLCKKCYYWKQTTVSGMLFFASSSGREKLFFILYSLYQKVLNHLLKVTLQQT